MTIKREIEIKTVAKSLGFDAVGITAADLPEEYGLDLAAFISKNYHGEMSWLETRQEQRKSPDALWPEARSVIMLGVNYGPATDPMQKLADKLTGNISVYAQNKDYHDTIKKRLKQLGRQLVEKYGCEIKVFVDTAPVMEKPLAQRSSLGWQGKHTNLVSREFGSWLFLGAIYTTLDLKFEETHNDQCGSCQSCLDACPTDAFPAPYQIDARKCISYLTIEHKGSIPVKFRKAMGNRIYGCDDCLAVCPWNKFAQQTKELAFIPRDELKAPALSELVLLDDVSFRQYFKASPIKRIGRDRFIRNVLIAIGNSEEISLLPFARKLKNDPAEIVSEAAHWAENELLNHQPHSTQRKTLHADIKA